MRNVVFGMCVVFAAGVWAAGGAADAPSKAADLPLGHPDFYPSSEHPIGWRGDRSGAFPGATPVTTWNSKTGANIVWKCRMPTPSWSTPIVVGDKVFTTADPNLLICVSIKTGAILWQKEVDHTTQMPPEKAKKAKEELAWFDRLFPIYVDHCRLMAKAQTMANARKIDESDLKDAVMKRGGIDPAFTNAAFEQALADPEMKPMLETLVENRRKYGFGFTDPHRGDNWAALIGFAKHNPGPVVKAMNDRLDALIGDYDMWAWPRQNWYDCCSMTFATPCSDGHFVYVAFPNNQVAAYDLNGTEQWMVWDHPPQKQKQDGLLQTRFVPSPVLAGDYLVVNQNDEIRAFDKKTGKKIWGLWDPYRKAWHRKDDPDSGTRNSRPEPEAKSPVHMRLPLAGKFLDVIACCGGNIYRLGDGKIIGTGVPGANKGQSPAAQGDLLVWKDGGDNQPHPMGVCRLIAKSPDEVECVKLWTDDTANGGGTTPMISNGMVFNDTGAWEALSGKRLATIRMRSAWNSPILIGECIIGSEGKKVASWKQPEKIIENVLQDDIETLDPEWGRRVYCGMARTFGNSSWYAAGNRLFFRTAGHLWCMGDPSTPWQTPKDAPPEARAAGN